VSQYLMVAGIGIAATLGAVFRRAGRRWRDTHAGDATEPNRHASIIGVVLLTSFCTAQIPVWQYGLHLTEVWHQARRQAQALLLFLPHLRDQGRLVSMETLDKESAGWHCIDSVNTLARLGLLRTCPLESPELRWFAVEKPLSTTKADVTSAGLLEDGTLELRGHARFNVDQPVDAILIVQNGRVISLGQPTPRPLLRIYGLDYEFSNSTDVQVHEMYPWHAQVKLPPTAQDAPLELWALDVQRRRVSRIGATVLVNGAAKTVDITRP
jgi:hypothetical protein